MRFAFPAYTLRTNSSDILAYYLHFPDYKKAPEIDPTIRLVLNRLMNFRGKETIEGDATVGAAKEKTEGQNNDFPFHGAAPYPSLIALCGKPLGCLCRR